MYRRTDLFARPTTNSHIYIQGIKLLTIYLRQTHLSIESRLSKHVTKKYLKNLHKFIKEV